MTGDGRGSGNLPGRVVGIAMAVALMVVGVLVVAPGTIPGRNGSVDSPTWPPVAPGTPIAAEAGVFRLRPGDLAAAPDVDRREEAHPRTMKMYRELRAYPGAPPRIPHGLTEREFRGGRCNVCHRRGGYVERFAAYAPVTPHPELGECLQCHVADDALVGIAFRDDTGQEDVCFQCHVLDRTVPRFSAMDWPEPAWPELHASALPGAPPPIPHTLQLRENCLACHVGAGAVEDIHTPHAERANCRQCHVEAGEAITDFERPGTDAGRVSGGGS